MQNIKWVFILLFAMQIFDLSAQTIKGKVYEKNAQQQKNYLPGVNVYWLNTTIGAATDLNGAFEIAAKKLPAKLVVSYVGYKADTILISEVKLVEIELKNAVELDAVTIEAREQTTKISTISSINLETISTKELQKAACCNLSESFETNASVDVSFKDGVSGTKQIQMLGLDGIYTQILSECLPAIRGLSSGFGLNLIPGTWVESIQITKGAGSVLNGYESITGQINVELQKPENADKFFFNGYANHAGRYEGNMHYAHKLNDKWSTMLLSHASTVMQKNDFNKDGFIDMPLMNQFNGINRWKFEGEKMMAQFGIKALTDNRQSGQTIFNEKADIDSLKAYGIGIDTKQYEFFSKTALRLKDPYSSIGLQTSIKRFEQNSYFGLKNYTGKENTASFNLLYQTILGHSDHKLTAGGSYFADQYQETFNDSAFGRNESVPGVFAEYTYEIEQKFSFVAGLRSDFHNLYGTFFTPRVHLKFHPSELVTLRLSAGKGLRFANVFIDNASLMASSRKINILEKLNPEVAWNYGFNYTHKFNLFHREAVFNADYFYTDFVNQVVADFDQAFNKVNIYNLDGISFSHSVQTEFTFEPLKNLSLKAAYKWYDVRRTYHGDLLQVPFQSKNRVLFNTAYSTKFDKWKFDFTAKWYDKSRIPEYYAANGVSLHGWSDAYFLFNSQITRTFKKFDIYLGGENLSNFMQHNAIISANEPFSDGFDASLIWGPVMGRIIYGGIRMTIK